jgi:hypothetical protein
MWGATLRRIAADAVVERDLARRRVHAKAV